MQGGYAYCEKLESILYEGLSLHIPIILPPMFMRFGGAVLLITITTKFAGSYCISKCERAGSCNAVKGGFGKRIVLVNISYVGDEDKIKQSIVSHTN